jgi:hypothetical protein
VVETFWLPQRGLFADNAEGTCFSEHAQCFAVLSDSVPRDHRSNVAVAMAEDKDLARTTLAFSHYLFEAYRRLDRPDLFHQRLRAWPELLEIGLKTTPEQPEPTRSDCHAWTAHILHHARATVLGVRPAAMGFAEVEVRPWLGPLRQAAGRIIHPQGWIEVELQQDGVALHGQVTLPEGVAGRFLWADQSTALGPGPNPIAFKSTLTP